MLDERSSKSNILCSGFNHVSIFNQEILNPSKLRRGTGPWSFLTHGSHGKTLYTPQGSIGEAASNH